MAYTNPGDNPGTKVMLLFTAAKAKVDFLIVAQADRGGGKTGQT